MLTCPIQSLSDNSLFLEQFSHGFQLKHVIDTHFTEIKESMGIYWMRPWRSLAGPWKKKKVKRKRPGVIPAFSASEKRVNNWRFPLPFRQSDQAAGAYPLEGEGNGTHTTVPPREALVKRIGKKTIPATY